MRKTSVKQKNTRFLISALFFAFFMFGFGYALVPLYDVLCDTLGILGKTSNEAVAVSTDSTIDTSRTVRVNFLVTRNRDLDVDFYPDVKTIEIHPGENYLTHYVADNLTSETMTLQAIPSVAPGVAARYLRKTECFCFTQQSLPGSESADMPLLFHIDRDLPAHIEEINLSYTMFDASAYKQVDDDRVGRLF